MPADDTNVVEAARRAYADDREAIVEVAARLGVSAATIRRWRVQHQWPLRSVRRKAAIAKAARRGAAASTAARKPPPKTRVDSDRETPGTDARSREALIQRLYRAIYRKLEHLETSMETADPPSAADTDRETRAIGTLIRNVEKVAELETDLTRADTSSAAGARPASLYGGDDADARRRELAERILKVRERHRERQPE